ncbi:protein phosphatase 1 regulatory subunit 35 [Pristis pectinata]|uniref:protein phosphatase 1 regulatory subunit 35 n=1 Tax=Pristis pectinata TaxID=685728 RepID=UPI00223DE944|nr:protein phosphatase 1 regulatory subunit 35 [Pristis pectinata]XP_051900609.1 protein phosphatase 1 regulatory subunit 35 [Pristis pectinata]XP_051900610.1 protein phosphatase 1 regulatory subunit 35 [Pristis pectinata]XP_051900611.1 protein phosphatase 1 regulatory subunit 35 [Pristis pectinata]
MKCDTLRFPAKMYTPQNYVDEDSLPIWAAPRPLLVGPAEVDSVPDLDVSLTPDKMSKCTGILKKQEKAADEGVSGRVGRRQVRFDTVCESKSCDRERLIQGDPDNRPEDASPVNPALELDPKTSDSIVQPLTNPSSVFSTDRKDKGPSHSNSRKNRAIKPARANKLVKLSGLLGGAEDRQDRPLAVPEYNTTLALGQELQQLKEAGFDARRAAADQLKKSSVTRQCVEGKVTEGLNVPKDLQRYRGLVSLEVPVDEVLNSAIQEKMLLVKPRAESKKHTVGVEAPDLMVFYNASELLMEDPHLSVDGLPTLKVQPQPKPAASCFDLYRKLKQWEA